MKYQTPSGIELTEQQSEMHNVRVAFKKVVQTSEESKTFTMTNNSTCIMSKTSL